MTTLTIDKELLEQVVNKLLTCWPKSDPLVNELRAALAAPATAPDQAFVCTLGCTTECLARQHGVPSECPSLPRQPATAPERKPKPFIGTRNAIYKCTDCGHEQSVMEFHTEHGVYVGSGANWCDKCELGKPERKEQP